MLSGDYILTILLLNKSDLSILNKRTLKYKLADAEKDYFLAIVSKIIYNSPLREKLVFKGGTAIYHCYLQQARLSEDLDFTSLDKSITLKDVKSVFELYDFLEIKKDYISNATIKIERLKYNGPLGLPNSLKVEIDYLQNVVLPTKELFYRNVWGVTTKIQVMDVKEICAEKIRAISARALYRDFYDLLLLFEHFKFELKEIVELIRHKEIRKPITQESIRQNWVRAKKEKEAELSTIFYSKEVSNSSIETLINKIMVKIK